MRNLGFDEDATHTKNEQHTAYNLKTHKLNWPIQIPVKLNPNIDFYETVLKEHDFPQHLRTVINNQLSKIYRTIEDLQQLEDITRLQ